MLRQGKGFSQEQVFRVVENEQAAHSSLKVCFSRPILSRRGVRSREPLPFFILPRPPPRDGRGYGTPRHGTAQHGIPMAQSKSSGLTPNSRSRLANIAAWVSARSARVLSSEARSMARSARFKISAGVVNRRP